MPAIGRHRPGKAPAVAVEHRQRPEIDRVRRHTPGDDLRHCVQVRAAVVRDHTLRVARRARGIVQGNRTELVLRQGPGEIGIAFLQERFVVHSPRAACRPACRGSSMSITSGRRSSSRSARLYDSAEFAVGDQYFCFAVRELESNRFGIEPDVQRVQHRAGHRHAEMRLVDRGNIGRHHGDGIARTHATLLQSRCEAAAAGVGLRPGAAPLAVDNGDPIGIGLGGLRQEAQRRERGVVRLGLTQASTVRAAFFTMACDIAVYSRRFQRRFPIVCRWRR